MTEGQICTTHSKKKIFQCELCKYYFCPLCIKTHNHANINLSSSRESSNHEFSITVEHGISNIEEKISETTSEIDINVSRVSAYVSNLTNQLKLDQIQLDNAINHLKSKFIERTKLINFFIGKLEKTMSIFSNWSWTFMNLRMKMNAQYLKGLRPQYIIDKSSYELLKMSSNELSNSSSKIQILYNSIDTFLRQPWKISGLYGREYIKNPNIFSNLNAKTIIEPLSRQEIQIQTKDLSKLKSPQYKGKLKLPSLPNSSSQKKIEEKEAFEKPLETMKFASSLDCGGIILHAFVDSSLELYLNNIMSQQVRIYSLTYPSSGGSGYCASTMIKNQIIITGGYCHKYLATCLIIDVTDDLKIKMIKGPELKIPRSSHTLVPIGLSKVYCLGGNNGHELKNTESIIMDNKDWALCPNLNFANSYITACSFEGKYIFVFEGKSHKNMECLNLSKEEEGWQILRLQMAFNNRGHAFALQINSTSILIFGGFNGCLDANIFNIKLGKMEKVENKILEYSYFRSSNALIKNNIIHVINNNTKSIVKFNLQTLRTSYDRRLTADKQ